MTFTLLPGDIFHLLLGLFSLLGIVYLIARPNPKEEAIFDSVYVRTIFAKEPMRYAMSQHIQPRALDHIPYPVLVKRFREDFALDFSHQIHVTQEKSIDRSGIVLREELLIIPDA